MIVDPAVGPYLAFPATADRASASLARKPAIFLPHWSLSFSEDHCSEPGIPSEIGHVEAGLTGIPKVKSDIGRGTMAGSTPSAPPVESLAGICSYHPG